MKTKFEPKEVPKKERRPNEAENSKLGRGTPQEVLLI